MADSLAGTVVVVEDDASLCQALEKSAACGIEGRYLSLRGSFPYAGQADNTICMVIDVQLPGIDAFTLHERLVAHGAAPPVIFITAFDAQDARAHAVRAGAARYLAKPFAGRKLLETIEAIQRARKSS